MFRKGVSALIKNHKGEFLIVNLQSFEERYFAIPGGGLDEGETLEEALYREIFEELGIDRSLLKLVAKNEHPLRFKFKEIKLNRDGKEYEGSERYFFGLEFLGSDSDINIDKKEVRSYRWVAVDKLGEYLLFDNQIEETNSQINKLFGY